MQKNKGALLLVLGILVITMVLFLKIGEINNRMQTLNQNYSHIQSNIQSITSSVNQSLDRFTREQSWITPVHVNGDKSKIDNEQSAVVLDWQIKDFKQGSKVLFHYRNSDSEAFKEIPASSQNTGFFEVQIPMEIIAEPSWEIHVTSEIEMSREGAIKAEEAKKIEADKAINCYVSMETKDFIKSSEISDLHIGYLAYKKYGSINGHVDIHGEKCQIILFGNEMIGDNSFESINVQFYSDDKLLAEKPLERHDVKKDRQD